MLQALQHVRETLKMMSLSECTDHPCTLMTDENVEKLKLIIFICD